MGRANGDEPLLPPGGLIEPTSTFRWWLRLQVGLALAGGGAWFVGAAVDQEFVTGAGFGLLIAALVLRLGRQAADGPE